MKGEENIIEPSWKRILAAQVLLEAVETGPEAKIRFRCRC
jgi:hypothetical protein